jgi:hypothetical protein
MIHTVMQLTHIYKKCGLDCSIPIAEKESEEYDAHTLSIENKNAIYRKAKITPTKIGQFVTLWKRIVNGTIAPFESTEAIEYVIVNCVNKEYNGIFIFPKNVLVNQGVFSTPLKEGKRAIRVYPPWDIAINKQAIKTQKWQLLYFVHTTNINITTLRKLL